jgi:glucose dehydrogenase
LGTYRIAVHDIIGRNERTGILGGLSGRNSAVCPKKARRDQTGHFTAAHQLAWRYSALDQINTANVKKVVLAWAFQTGDYEQGLQATPIVVDGVPYLSTTHSWVFALDAARGKMLWQYRYLLPRGAGGNIQNRGVAVGAGRVFVGTYDDYVVALDQKTGAEVWKAATNDSKQCGCSITSAPLFVKDKVIVGVAGGDGAFRGYLTAFDAKTGRFAWRFFTIPGKREKGNETWKGD